MKIHFILFFFITTLCCTAVTGNSQWRIPADSIYQLIKKNSVFKSNVNWSSIDARFESCFLSTLNNEDVIKCLVNVFKELDDVNSSIIYKNQSFAYHNHSNQDSLLWLNPLREKCKSEKGKIKTQLLKDKYAYIVIPELNSNKNEINKIAQILSDSIARYNDTNVVKGFIIDLRLNTGGQMASCLAGLHSLLGNGLICNEKDENEKKLSSWSLDGGNLSIQGVKQTTIKESSIKLDQIPVTLLISPLTEAAGTAAAIAFRYRPNTYFIGEATAEGFTTSTTRREISNELTLNLSESYITDRKGHIYPKHVPADIQVQGGDNFDNLLQDYKIRTAIRWLERKKIK